MKNGEKVVPTFFTVWRLTSKVDTTSRLLKKRFASRQNCDKFPGYEAHKLKPKTHQNLRFYRSRYISLFHANAAHACRDLVEPKTQPDRTDTP